MVRGWEEVLRMQVNLSSQAGVDDMRLAREALNQITTTTCGQKPLPA